MRGPTVFAGYLDEPEATAAAFLPSGWFLTGDLGYLDADGLLYLTLPHSTSLYLTGRRGELINRRGEKIAPVEVDRVLVSHPAVAAAAVFPVPDAHLGEDLVAAVVLKPGLAATRRELRRWMQDRLSRFEVPCRIWFVETLPRASTGKVQRGVLAARFSAVGQMRRSPLVRQSKQAR